jgi:hypothetical protein
MGHADCWASEYPQTSAAIKEFLGWELGEKAEQIMSALPETETVHESAPTVANAAAEVEPVAAPEGNVSAGDDAGDGDGAALAPDRDANTDARAAAEE